MDWTRQQLFAMARIVDPPLPPLQSVRLPDQVRECIRYLRLMDLHRDWAPSAV
jgi:hypothetical protein